MKRTLLAALALAVTMPATMAQPKPPTPDAKPIVASIDGEALTKARFDEVWDRIPPHLQKQYEIVGGKPAFLQNYVQKRLLLRNALRSGFAPEAAAMASLNPAEESALFDRYVREVIAISVVTDGMIRQSYNENRGQFAHPDQVKLRHILIKTEERPFEEARQKILPLMDELQELSKAVSSDANLLRDRFAALATEHSEDDSAAGGGLVGWVGLETLDPAVGDAAFEMKVGTVSDVVQSTYGLHLLFIDASREAGVEPYEVAAPDIREVLLAQNMKSVMEAVNRKATELLASTDVKLFPENL